MVMLESAPIQRQARLHEETVQRAEQHASAYAERVKRVKQSAPVTTIRPHPDVWSYALKIAHGDASRIRILSESEVRVENQPVR